MKSLKIPLLLGGIVLLGVAGAMAVTNPDKPAYDDYATERLTLYLKDDLCAKAPVIFGVALQNQCRETVNNNQSQLEQIISANTNQQNFLLFSLYKTDLSIGPPLPSYHFETIGVFYNFYTYKAEQR